MKINTNTFCEEALKSLTKQNDIKVKTLKKVPKNACIDEESLADDYAYKWADAIKERGEDYYYSDSVLKIIKSKNKYLAKVEGSAEKPYSVSIEVLPDEDDIKLDCTCPCTYPCKHEYAVLLAISNHEYEKIELKTAYKEKKVNLLSLIEEIPADEIKKYMLSPIGKDKTAFEETSFNNYFRKYMPIQKYDFYYNNLYNALVLNDDYVSLIELYFERIRQYISGNDFREAFKIEKSIIEAYNDSNRLNFDEYVFEMINKMGILMRITQRKSSKEVKRNIIVWTQKVLNDNCYNNCYLEDLILSLK